jgi:UDP-2,3-diacylglucosamine hydrolase
MSDHTLFIADLHLTPERPQINAAFFGFLEVTAINADALYILGDFFETWLGDDDLADPLHTEIASRLKHLSDSGVPVWLMHGNRDFLLADDFFRASGAHRLVDPSVIDLYGTPTLLMHGDSLCTDDAPYQQFRQQVRNPQWQATFLQRPLTERRALAAALRAQSEQTKADKTPEIMDVNASAVAQALHDSGTQRLIHGHTHHPARHTHDDSERWVLPAWYAGAGWIECSAHGCALHLPEAGT